MTTNILDAGQTTGRALLESLCAYLEHLFVQEPVEQEAPPQMRSPDGAAPAGEVTAIDEKTMKEEDLQEAVGLLTQLEVRPQNPQVKSRSWHHLSDSGQVRGQSSLM